MRLNGEWNDSHKVITYLIRKNSFLLISIFNRIVKKCKLDCYTFYLAMIYLKCYFLKWHRYVWILFQGWYMHACMAVIIQRQLVQWPILAYRPNISYESYDIMNDYVCYLINYYYVYLVITTNVFIIITLFIVSKKCKYYASYAIMRYVIDRNI